MKYFKNINNEIHAFEDDITLELLAKYTADRGLIAITDAEFITITTPTTEQLESEIRARRDGLLREFDTEIYCNALRWSDYSIEQQAAYTIYRQALLDIPTQAGFPVNVAWPERP